MGIDFLGNHSREIVACITQEAQFPLSITNEDTQSVFLDEWSDRTLASDMAKVVLQGGFMVQAIKHGKPRSIDGKPRSMENRIPFYITTDELPYFGNDDVNVKRRVRVLQQNLLTDVKQTSIAGSTIIPWTALFGVHKRLKIS